MKEIKNEQRRIQRLMDLSGDSESSGRGTLHLERRGRNTYGYERWQPKGKPERRRYLGTLQSDDVRELFAVHLKKRRRQIQLHNLHSLDRIACDYQDDSYEAILADLPRAYRQVASGDSFDPRYEELRNWAKAPYPKNNFPFSEAEIYARDGTRMRSKGEALLYNLLQEHGILFRNDCQIVLTGQDGSKKLLCPDFLIQCYDGTFIIVEHLGRLTDLKYAIDFGERCHWYQQGGFILGKNFFVTSDDMHYGTDTEVMEELVARIEERFFGY